MIPARMASSRFPGKPLINLLGKTMIEHVWRRSKMCQDLDEVYVTTCDEEIKTEIENHGGKVIMTKPTHEMCMDRIVEAAQKVEDAEIIVTIQGDEPLIQPKMISQSIKMLTKDPSLPSATLAQEITDPSEVTDPNRVRMVWNKNKEILYISREVIPSEKKTKQKIKHYKMVCVYAMTKDFLLTFGALPMSYLETIESIDMLRIIENGYRLKVDITEGELWNIDVPADIDRVVRALEVDPLFKTYQNAQ